MARGTIRIARSSWLIAIASLGLYGVLVLSGTDAVLDRLLSPLRAAMVHRSASGRTAIVEMDAASVAAIARWPWSRANYAAVLDRLHAAGAASIVFDVDLSSAADEAGDAAFAASLRRADGLVALPTFGQASGSSDHRTIDALPIARFRDKVALASVSISPDPDGQIRSMPFATATAGIPRPSLSSYIAGQSGSADDEFAIDMTIDPASLPRLSFVAVRDGRFDPAQVRGRHILIGATAVEMGDRYSMPAWGVIPGVVIQALAAETLLRGTPSEGSWLLPLLLAATALVLLLRSGSGGRIAAIGGGSLTLLVTLVLVAQHVLLVTYPLAAAITLIAVAGAGCLTRHLLRAFKRHGLIDEETGLPTTRALLTRGATAPSALIVVADLGNFEAILAVLGATVTSNLLTRVGERLALTGRDGAVYRVGDRQLAFQGGIELLDGYSLEALRVVMLRPIEVAGRRIDVTIALGIADGCSEQALANAALAAGDAMQAGRFWQHAAADLAVLERSMSLMGELDDALTENVIEVFYQPKYHLQDDRIASVEALVRWHHASRGFIGPDVFIPMAEAGNRIARLTLYVLERVMRDAAAWRASGYDMTAAVNISAKLLSSPEFNAAVERLLETIAVSPSALIFEVTESAAMLDPEAAVAALNRYRALGIAVSMDDYGTGQSTLTYLRQLPLNELKIDRSFVQYAHENRADAMLVRSTIALAHEMGLKVVAEGVETEEGVSFLRSCGCDMIQGYVISRPVRLDVLMSDLASRYAKSPEGGAAKAVA